MGTKTSTRLADGRELIYFATGSVPKDAPPDRRDLPPPSATNELRYDPLLDTWVIYAAHRQHRSYLPATADCPLCPSRDGKETEIPAPSYEVVVFENRFPSLAGSGERPGPAEIRDGLFTARGSAGRCEVVCFSDDHDGTFATLSEARVGLVLEALIDRTTELGRREDVEQVFCFENRGREIGVTQSHPHGQIYAYPFVTQRTARALEAARRYERVHHANYYEDLVAAEARDGSRIVTETEHFVAFVPFAARWPYEVHCYPKTRVPELAALADEALAELPRVLLDLHGRFARLFNEPAPYIAGWHQAPVREGREHYACHLELFTFRRDEGKLKYLAGSESGMDAFASDVIPEAAASRLREVVPAGKGRQG